MSDIIQEGQEMDSSGHGSHTAEAPARAQPWHSSTICFPPQAHTYERITVMVLRIMDEGAFLLC